VQYSVIKKAEEATPRKHIEYYIQQWVPSEENWFAFDHEYGCTESVNAVCLKALEAASRKISAQAKEAFQQTQNENEKRRGAGAMTPPSTFYNLSYLFVKTDDNTVRKGTESQVCGNPACQLKSKFHCSKCRRQRYCSKVKVKLVDVFCYYLRLL
jgi:hypothetical protein